MKGIVLVVLVVVIVFFTFSSCSNNKSIPYLHRVNAIVGDCYNDSLLSILDIRMKELGWENNDTIKFTRNYSSDFNEILKFIDEYNRNIKVMSYWSIKIKKNNLIAHNHWFEEYGWGPAGYNTLATDKQDTLFWNIINILKQYCNVRDTSYIIDMSPELKLNDQND